MCLVDIFWCIFFCYFKENYTNSIHKIASQNCEFFKEHLSNALEKRKVKTPNSAVWNLTEDKISSTLNNASKISAECFLQSIVISTNYLSAEFTPAGGYNQMSTRSGDESANGISLVCAECLEMLDFDFIVLYRVWWCNLSSEIFLCKTNSTFRLKLFCMQYKWL